MSTATIQIQYLDPPKEGKKQATVKTVDGQRFGVFAEKVSEFGLAVGKTANIEFTSRDYQGKTYHTITKVTSVSESANGNGQAAPVATNGREGRIERQAALKVAVLLLAAGVQAGKDEPTLKNLFEYAEEIESFIANAGQVKPQSSNQTSEPEVEL